MTRDEILNMPAGREMDSLVLDVLEFTVDDNFYIDYYSTSIEYSLNALYAWLDAHPTYAVHIETVNITTGRLHDVILWGMDEEPVYDARAEELPLAICRVLLTTLEDK